MLSFVSKNLVLWSLEREGCGADRQLAGRQAGRQAGRTVGEERGRETGGKEARERDVLSRQVGGRL